MSADGVGTNAVMAVTGTSKSKSVTLNYLRANPNTRGVIVIDGNAAIGAAEAVDQLGIPGKVPIAGIGVPSTIRPYIKSGTVYSSVL